MQEREIRDHKLKILVMLSFYNDYNLDELLDKYFINLPYEDKEYKNEYTGDLSIKYFDVYKKDGHLNYSIKEKDKKNLKEVCMDSLYNRIKIFLKNFYEREKEILEILTKNLKGWNINHIPRCEKYILMIAVYEMYFDENIKDINIPINEAVLLAKVYGMDDRADKFINGILGTVYKSNENINSN